MIQWIKKQLLLAFSLLWKKEKINEKRLTQAELEPPTRTIMFDNPGIVLGYDEWDSVDGNGKVICRKALCKMSEKYNDEIKNMKPLTRKDIRRLIR